MALRGSTNHSEALENLKRAVTLVEEAARRQSIADQAPTESEVSQGGQIARSIATLVRAVREAASAQPEVRQSLQRLGEWLIALAQSGQAVKSASTDQPVLSEVKPLIEKVASSTVAVESSVVTAPSLPAQSVTLHLGDSTTRLHVPGTPDEANAARSAAERARNGGWSAEPSSPIPAPSAPIDMTLLAKRCRLKAEGCEWAARYRDNWEQDIPDAAGRNAMYESIISRAKALPSCYVWALNPRLVIPDGRHMSQYAQCYGNLATAAELVESVHREGPHGGNWLLETYSALAQAQSALRAALETDALYNDTDQEEAFRWLRTRTSEDRILVPRHMKLDDPADIADGEELSEQLSNLRARLADLRQQGSQRLALLRKAKFHAKILREGRSDDADGDWRKLIDSLAGVVESGTPPSDIEIREIVAPIIDQLPDTYELPAKFEQVVESVDEYLATREVEGAANVTRQRAVSPEVAEAATLLDGKVVVLIGGQVRPESKRALEREFRLAELRWIPAAHHQSHYLFEAAVARLDTAVVMVAIRWSAHAFGNVEELCTKHGKPFVRLPGGYSPNQVARQILDQVGDRLRRDGNRLVTSK